jgi:hypothetical protein
MLIPATLMQLQNAGPKAYPAAHDMAALPAFAKLAVVHCQILEFGL